ncbi:uncharacterized protein FIBRA_03641 [Fibroporia radiculosa]|uniref:Uncharacterized protein n=1 Tax=Fibroporia radiculosa TaxID=599839 RepID=J4I9Q7_9APHY|nr:uncharacterized protein FIBRA_03641 [Fibroporia radiculosa]CCM01581.1 predicted protein [Fibroporia radiculosa]
MSHFLSNPLQKPYLFELPRPPHPLTPPETDNDFNSQQHSSSYAHNVHAADAELASPYAATAETPAPLYRKPSLAYINSSGREHRERIFQRTAIKWLVVVIPPVSFARERGRLGHTLSSGTAGRLSQGILMPLFPTMGGQLGAIAREFNLPSVTGLCLYLHTIHNGVSLYPRISDESWHILWAHLFEARSPVSAQQQLPIGGQIEFDIDLAKARWYEAWVASPRKEAADVPHSVAHSQRQSLSHWRGESRTTFLDEEMDEQVDNTSQTQHLRGLANARRTGPKKLSLVDRFEVASVVSGSRLFRGPSPPSPSEEAQLRSLSPIVQEEEPKTARKDIDTFVHSWRASASIGPSPLAATGQTSLDAANMPNTMGDIETPDAQSELNLDDYAWSISSVGPPEYDIDDDDASIVWRLPSPDIAQRAMSDVPPTPSTATSWGAPLSYPPSPLAASVYTPSIGIAERRVFSRPVTPSTATSWGPPSYPVSPVDIQFRVPSPDVAARGLHSAPPTPSTATSWGPPSYAPSPVHSEFRVPSPDLGARSILSVPSSPLPVRLRPYTGSLTVDLTSRLDSTQSWCHVWPYQTQEVTSPASRLAFPYYNARGGSPWPHVWPYQIQDATLPMSRLTFPYQNETAVPELPSSVPVWKQVWPYVKSSTNLPEAADGSKYPYFNLYPAVYPSFSLYPPLSRVVGGVGEMPRAVLRVTYPVLTIYPAVYPHFDIYPAFPDERIEQKRTQRTVCPVEAPVIRMGVQYPAFELYPAVYPWNLQRIYPESRTVFDEALSIGVNSVDVRLSLSYPTFDIYPEVYPHNLQNIYPRVVRDIAPAAIETRLLISYPALEIYPAVYPHNLAHIYPSSATLNDLIEKDITYVNERVVPYPRFNIYPAVYPHNLSEIYPLLTADELVVLTKSSPLSETDVVVSLYTEYPAVVPYPAIYPWNLENIYPPSHFVDMSTTVRKISSISLALTDYPILRPYPPVYPHNLEHIYPPPTLANVSSSQGAISTALTVSYPHFDIYPAIYPHNLTCIYTFASSADTSSGQACSFPITTASICVTLTNYYPYVSPYPNMYPFLEIYPNVPPNITGKPRINIKANSYPVFDIYPALYPFLTIYPRVWTVQDSTTGTTTQHLSRRKPRFSHSQLHDMVFPLPTGLSQVTSPTQLSQFDVTSTPSRLRSRAGTVSMRPVPPPKPASVSSPKILSPLPSDAGSSIPRLSISPSATSRRPLTMIGLPAHPAVNRRMSSALGRSGPSSALPPPPTVIEPEAQSGIPQSVRRLSPRPSLESIEESSGQAYSVDLVSPEDAYAKQTTSATLPKPLVLGTPSDLSRAKTMPSSRGRDRERRASVVLQKARAYDQSSETGDAPMKITMSTLAQFPTPPRPPLPPLPNNRPPVSRLDRSKYPFA